MFVVELVWRWAGFVGFVGRGGLISRFEGEGGLGDGEGVIASYLYIPSVGMLVEPRDRGEK